MDSCKVSTLNGIFDTKWYFLTTNIVKNYCNLDNLTTNTVPFVPTVIILQNIMIKVAWENFKTPELNLVLPEERSLQNKLFWNGSFKSYLCETINGKLYDFET